MSLFGKKINTINILVLGSDGMLGHDVYEELLLQSQNKHSNINCVIGMDKKKIQENFFENIDHENIKDCTTSSCEQISFLSYFFFHRHYDYVINCVAMTDTNSAENTTEGCNLSYKLNALFVKKLAEACHRLNMKLIHISTDYVFSENSQDYRLIGFFPSDTQFPVNNYGMHKLLGEEFIKNSMKKKNYAILRTSWLYGNHNKKSFVHKFIKNAYKCMAENKQIEVTKNEYSVPTSTKDVIKYIDKILNENLYGTFHAVCNSQNPVSRLEFANEIAIIYNQLLKGYNYDIKPIDCGKIVGIDRNNKLQPEFSFMYATDLWYGEEYSLWQKSLTYFINDNFDDLKEIT